jgi:RNA polymerase sigma factor (TIGR02999 family)
MLRAAGASAADDERLMAAVYEDLKLIAHGRLVRERADHTLGTTDLVHESYLRLVDQRHADWHDRAHFYRVAAMMMRRVLVDHARKHLAQRRSGGRERVSLTDVDLAVDQQAEVVVEVNDLVDRLAALSDRLARVVECRWFAGYTEAETARILGLSERSVRRDWSKARGMLREALASG